MVNLRTTLSVFAALAALGAATPSRAAVVYSNGFGSNSTGFSAGTLTTAPSGEQFLSGLAGGSTLTITGLAAHTSVSLGFTLDVVGSMDGGPNPQFGGGPGDFFTVRFSGASASTVFNQTFANYGNGNTQNDPVAGSAPATGAASINGLKYTGFPDSGNGIQDSEYNFSLAPITDSSGTVSFTFTDLSNEGPSNEFYGIDNVSVSTNGTPVTAVPEPMTAALLGSALLGLAATRRSRI